MSTIKKRGRDLAFTVNELMESPRLKLAVASFEEDPLLLKALFTELGQEAESVAKYAVIRTYQLNTALTKPEIVQILKKVGTINCNNISEEDPLAGLPKKDINEMNTYNIWWGLSLQEAKMYLGNLDPKLSEEDRQKLLDDVKRKFGLM